MSAAAKPMAGAQADAPLVELQGVSRRFIKRLDIAEKIANRLGAHVREDVVHAVDRVDEAGVEAAGHRAQGVGRVLEREACRREDRLGPSSVACERRGKHDIGCFEELQTGFSETMRRAHGDVAAVRTRRRASSTGTDGPAQIFRAPGDV